MTITHNPNHSPRTNIPTALSDPEGYLSLRKFNLRIPRCRRTNLPVTFSDIGAEDGIPVLYLLPSGCSRWIAAPMDPLLKIYRVRMIVIDRPGCGGTGEVPLDQRIDRSCEMIVSVLEHLKVRPANILASSAGIYYALNLLTRHASAFSTGLNPPPKLYLLSPWSPLLPPEDPDHWPFKWDWIPSPLIATQHITTPHLIKAATQAQKAYEEGLKVYETSRSFVGRWFKTISVDPSSLFSVISQSTDSAASTTATTTRFSDIRSRNSDTATATAGDDEPSKSNNMGLGQSASDILSIIRGGGGKTTKATTSTTNTMKPSLGEGTDISNPQPPPPKETLDDAEHEEEISEGSRMWGDCQDSCCVACLTQSYMSAENSQGIGQEHLICLNRGTEETGSEWLKRTIRELADTVEFAQLGEEAEEVEFDLNLGLDLGKDEKNAGGPGLDGRTKRKHSRHRKVPYKMEIEVWWGWLDDMVPRKGQLWFNKILGSYPETIDLRVHDVEDGDHTDL
ncbi:uncharacterized protein I303_105994 [Kwoniella dejecticola CBS 10117]|uniref:AB hydrolase-1 domain-containing protein n=1 Tax=Kwoniella dejecticola CBS 10117 TaxID=1296121 RepID=A0A1A6A100_9TREE|nr:uncharacterized protein I303_06014 [Kwoniella dejecticola CBS 10117]OBR83734.1 hypothetical protein I303_06014 [Kwoniella dejecticola CBS 10117]